MNIHYPFILRNITSDNTAEANNLMIQTTHSNKTACTLLGANEPLFQNLNAKEMSSLSSSQLPAAADLLVSKSLTSHNPNKKQRKVVERKFTWAFVGATDKSTRRAMREAMTTVPNGQLIESTHFFGASNMPSREVHLLMLNSVFCPAPTGFSHPDSFRFYESLESGCFPIVDYHNGYWEEFLSSYTAKFWPHDPHGYRDFVFQINSWSEAPALVCRLAGIIITDHDNGPGPNNSNDNSRSDSVAALQQLQKRQDKMMQFWAMWKSWLAKTVADHVLA